MDSFSKDDLNDTQTQNDLEDVENSGGSYLYDLSQPLILDETDSFNEVGNDKHKNQNDDSTETFDKSKENVSDPSIEIGETAKESRPEEKTLVESIIGDKVDGISDADKPISDSKNDIFNKETEIETMEDGEIERSTVAESTCDLDDSEDVIQSSQAEHVIAEITESSLLRKRKIDDEISQSPKKMSKTDSDVDRLDENDISRESIAKSQSEKKDFIKVNENSAVIEKNFKENNIIKSNNKSDESIEVITDVSKPAGDTRAEITDCPISNTNRVSNNSDVDVSTNVDTVSAVNFNRDASDSSNSDRKSRKIPEEVNADSLEHDKVVKMDCDDLKTEEDLRNTDEDDLKSKDSRDQKENVEIEENVKAQEGDKKVESENKDNSSVKPEVEKKDDKNSSVKQEISSVNDKILENIDKDTDSIETENEEKSKLTPIEQSNTEKTPEKCSSPNMKSLNSSYETTLVNTAKVCSTPQSDGENVVVNHENENSDNIKSQNVSDLDTSEKPQFSIRRRTFYVEVEYSVHQNEQKEIRQVVCEDISDVHKHSCVNSDLSSGVLGDISKSISPCSATSCSISSAQNRLSTISNASRLSTMSRYSTSSTVSCLSSVGSLPSTGTNRTENFILPGLPIFKSKEKTLNQYQKLSTEQVDAIKTQWNNTEQLLKILEFIDHAPHAYSHTGSPNDVERLSSVLSDRSSMNFNSAEIKLTDRSDSEETLKTIKEVVTPRSTKKKGGGNRKSNRSSDVDLNVAAKNTIEDRAGPKVTKSAKRTKRTLSTNSASSAGHEKQTTPDRDLPPVESNLSIGLPVFARWTDRKYYSGTVDAYVKEGKWSVKFDDGNKKTLIEEFILKDCHTVLKGHSVYAIVGDDGEYDSGIVASIVTRHDSVKYEVEVDKGTKVIVTAQQLFLTEDQAKSIREIVAITPPTTPKRMGIISLDNIVDGKRMTRSKHQRTPTASPKPGVSGTRRKLETEDPRCNVIEEVSGAEAEFKPDTPAKSSKGAGRVKSIVKTDKRSARSKLREAIDESLLGPIPDEGSTLFAGLSFILNCAKPLARREKPVAEKTTSTGSSVESATETENEAMEFTKLPFIEEHLHAQITAGGGKMYRHFEDVSAEEYANLKLISNRPNKTVKYIQCMAAGVMILSHEWVVYCCKQNERRMFQELPYGWSVEQNRFVDSFHRPTSCRPLKNLLVTIPPNRDARFVEFWKRVCETAGGIVKAMESDDDDFQTATLVLANNECPEKVVQKAFAWDIPLLSTHWVIQSLIHGEARPFNANEKYAYDYTEYD